MRVVVCDTGPILHLREADGLWLLEKTGEVMAPGAVDRELDAQIGNWSGERPSWFRVVALSEDEARQVEQLRAIGGLGPGEAEALALARSRRVDWLLTDDASARMIGALLGLEVHGSLGVILWGAAKGHLRREQAFSLLDRLAKSSLWLSRRILDEAREALDRLAR